MALFAGLDDLLLAIAARQGAPVTTSNRVRRWADSSLAGVTDDSFYRACQAGQA